MKPSRFPFLVACLYLLAASIGAADASSAEEPSRAREQADHSLTVAAQKGTTGVPPVAYPLWDGQETVAQYARRVNLPETKTLDLGNPEASGLELVLIPAGKFIMGTPEPEPPWIGATILGIAGLVVLVMVRQILIRAVRQHRRPQFSLLWLIVVVLILGVAEHGGFRYWRAVQAKLTVEPGEWPAHAVTLTKAFYLGKFEVTQEQYMQVMGANPSNFKGASLPVETVSRDDAQDFCKKVSAKTGQTVRLPTEAEWEFACRAGTTMMYYTGDAEADFGRAAWYSANSGHTTHPVGQKEPNAFGLHDMLGNVGEWCEDWCGEYPPGPVTDPKGRADGEARVLRGGSWGSSPRWCRSAYRHIIAPDYRGDHYGFRLVLAGPP